MLSYLPSDFVGDFIDSETQFFSWERIQHKTCFWEIFPSTLIQRQISIEARSEEELLLLQKEELILQIGYFSGAGPVFKFVIILKIVAPVQLCWIGRFLEVKKFSPAAFVWKSLVIEKSQNKVIDIAI